MADEESKELTPKEEFDKIEEEIEAATERGLRGERIELNVSAIANVIDFINRDREKADELINYFRNKIEMDGDRLSATREAMTKSLEVRNKAIDQLLKFLEIQAKMAIAQAEKESAGAGVTVNVFDGEVRIDKRTLIEKIEKGEL